MGHGHLVSGICPGASQCCFSVLVPDPLSFIIKQKWYLGRQARAACYLLDVYRDRNGCGRTRFEIVTGSASADFDAAGSIALHRERLAVTVDRGVVAGHLVWRSESNR